MDKQNRSRTLRQTGRSQIRSCSPPVTASAPQRLLSLDALRGFTMFWLIGGREFVLAARPAGGPPFRRHRDATDAPPLEKGFVAWDMSCPCSCSSSASRCRWLLPSESGRAGRSGRPYRRIARRVAVLWILGIIVQQIRYTPAMPELYSNTLQAIAVG